MKINMAEIMQSNDLQNIAKECIWIENQLGEYRKSTR